MQIHELNNFTGTLGSGAYLAVDDGTDTGKISSQGLLAATEARIDNIIAGPAPSAQEVTDARLGADGVVYPSLGDAIRDQVTDLKSDINTSIVNLLGATADLSKNVRPTGWETSNATLTFADNVMKVDATGQYGGAKTSINVIADHTYYYYSVFKSTSTKVSLSWNGNFAVFSSGTNVYELKSAIHTFAVSETLKIAILDSRASDRDTIYVKEIGVIDLTACFGVGNEPTVEKMDKIIAEQNCHIIGIVGAGALSRNNFNDIHLIESNLSTVSLTPEEKNVAITSISNEKPIARGDIKYSADSLSIVTNGNTYCGIVFYIRDFNVGQVVRVKSSRTGGNYTATMRVDCYDSNNQRINAEHKTQNTTIEQVVLPSTSYVEITLFACWGVALPSGSEVTFSNIEIEVSNALTDAVLAPKEHHSTVISITNDSGVAIGSRLYKADQLVMETDGNAYSGLVFNIYNPNIGDVITVEVGSRVGGNFDMLMRADCLNASGQRITGRENHTANNELQCLVLEGTDRVEVTLYGCWGTALPADTQVTFNDVEITTSEVFGYSGNLLYVGEPIVLTSEYRKPNKCNYDLWKNFVGADIPDLADYNLYKQQSMAIYNDYVFMLNEGGDGIILDFDTKEIIATISTTPTTYQHHNSAQFTDIFYDDGDEFPLLMTSMCGNQTAELTEYDHAQLYRITRSGTTFTFELINTISTDFVTRGNSWGVDNGNNKLYMIGGRTAYSDPDFVCEFFVWNMPSKADILNGTPIVVKEVDRIAYMTYPRFTVQGMFVNGGIAYVGRSITGVGQFVHTVDIFANRLLSEIPLADYKEVEGVCLYGDSIFVSQKDGTDTSATNPAKIYKISFGY